MNIRNLFFTVAVSAATAVASVWGYGKYYNTNGFSQDNGKIPANYAAFYDGKDGKGNPDFRGGGGPVDFTVAAAAATPAVVHIKTKTKARTVANGGGQQRSNPFSDLFGDNDMFGDIFGQRGPQVIPQQQASGSGVIISDDGYIVTNNHVIEGADEINVTLTNKKSYKAELIGADPSSDLAVLKIVGTGFPFMPLGNSDDVKLGQWCLAIGYPLTLDVTVTAGIISAKARTLGLSKSQSPIESYIQTDAAVNPGNSGGALVDTDGKLIGINSAIASPTGSYAGYSYAIPVNIVKKIANDIKKFGAVQRAYLGLSYAPENIPEERKKEMGVKDGVGIFVTDVTIDGAAKAAGILKGDFITGINGVKVYSPSEMVEQIANYKPGDKVTVNISREGIDKTTTVTLKNKAGSLDIVKNGAAASLNEKLGGELETFNPAKAKAAGIEGGVLVKKITDGVLKTARIQEGFVVTGVNGVAVKNLDQLKKALTSTPGIIRLDGVYPPDENNYTYPLNLSYSSNGDNQ